MIEQPSCRVVLVTPAGRGAIATLIVSGPRACQAIEHRFSAAAGRPMGEFPLGRIIFGQWRGAAHEAGEDLIVCRHSAEEIEIHCHGGEAAASRILDHLLADGCQSLTPQQWLSERIADPIAVEALIALAEVRTQRAAGILLDQHRGALRVALDQLHGRLTENRAQDAAALLERLLELAPVGRHLTQPWQVVLAGRPNAGKSSLINALVGYRRAIVHDTPGTTRDVVTAHTALDGWLVELADTAGLRSGGEALEQEGMIRARERLESCDLAVIVCDAADPWTDEDAALCAQFPAALVVHSKCDLAPARLVDRPPGLLTSVATGQGIDALAAELARRLVPCPPEPGAAVPFTARQIAGLTRVAGILYERGPAEAGQAWRDEFAGGVCLPNRPENC